MIPVPQPKLHFGIFTSVMTNKLLAIAMAMGRSVKGTVYAFGRNGAVEKNQKTILKVFSLEMLCF
jgi:hypothetical protein